MSPLNPQFLEAIRVETQARRAGIALFVDTDGGLKVYGKTQLRKRPDLRKLLIRHYYVLCDLIVSRSL